jgi:hypothetical protein
MTSRPHPPSRYEHLFPFRKPQSGSAESLRQTRRKNAIGIDPAVMDSSVDSEGWAATR